MKFNKIELFLAIFVFLVFLVFAALFILSLTANKNNDLSKAPVSVTIAPANKIIKQDPVAQEKLINILDNRPSFSISDAEIREKILGLLENETGVLYFTENVIISYVKSADVFQGEILTTEVLKAKNETVKWFTDEGLSAGGVCKLPLMFFLGPDARDTLENKNITFSPLPPGC